MARDRVERLWIGGGSIAAVVVAAIAWIAIVSPKLSDASSLRSQTDSARSDNAVLQAKIDKLRTDRANIGALKQSLADAQAALPPDAGLAAFTRQIGAQAAAAHVTVTSITASPPAPAAGAAAPAAGAAAPAAPAGAAAPAATAPVGGATSSSPATAPAAGAAPVAGGLYSIPITIAVTGSPVADLRFLQAIQTGGPRAVLVTSAQLSGPAAGATGGGSTLTIQLQVFAAPQAAQPSPSASANP